VKLPSRFNPSHFRRFFLTDVPPGTPDIFSPPVPIHTRPSAIPAAKTPEGDTADDNMNGGDIETPEVGGDVTEIGMSNN
jgi:hypothetical protein